MTIVKLSHAAGTIPATVFPYTYPFVAPPNTFVGYVNSSFPCGYDTTIDGAGNKCADYLNSNTNAQHFTYTGYTFSNPAYPNGFSTASLFFSVATPPGTTPVSGQHSASVNTTIVCPPGYKYKWMNENLCELPGQFSISLQIPPPAEVEPNATKSAYAQVLNGSSPQSGVQVSLAVIPPAGGGVATLIPVSGVTGADGKLAFTFYAPAANGIYSLTARCISTACTNQATGVIEVKAQYIITLSGGSTTEPWNKKRDQYHKAANLPFVAVVTDQNNQPKAGISVSISSDVTPSTGGHSHNDGRPKGKLVATQGNPVGAVSTVSGAGAISGVTDKGGIFWFTFGAEQASGEHTITANCTGCKAPAMASVKAEIQNLTRLGDDNTCTTSFCLQGGKTPHLDNHYYTGAAQYRVVQLANAYITEYGEPLQINDSSLIKGGLYDLGQNWAPSHVGHRKGIVVDVNNYHVEDIDFEIFARKNLGIEAVWEGPDRSPTPHYHLLLLGKGKDQ